MNEVENLPQEKLNSLGEYAKRARELAEAEELLTEKLKKTQEELRTILEKSMPDIMLEIGIDQIKLTTGEKLTRTPFYSASIKPEFQEQAFNWLRTNGFDSLIKNELKGTFGKGQDEEADKAMQLLTEQFPGIFTQKVFVHPMTLKSFVKEQVESGSSIPMDAFGVYIGQRVTIK